MLGTLSASALVSTTEKGTFATLSNSMHLPNARGTTKTRGRWEGSSSV